MVPSRSLYPSGSNPWSSILTRPRKHGGKPKASRPSCIQSNSTSSKARPSSSPSSSRSEPSVTDKWYGASAAGVKVDVGIPPAPAQRRQLSTVNVPKGKALAGRAATLATNMPTGKHAELSWSAPLIPTWNPADRVMDLINWQPGSTSHHPKNLLARTSSANSTNLAMALAHDNSDSGNHSRKPKPLPPLRSATYRKIALSPDYSKELDAGQGDSDDMPGQDNIPTRSRKQVFMTAPEVLQQLQELDVQRVRSKHFDLDRGGRLELGRNGKFIGDLAMKDTLGLMRFSKSSDAFFQDHVARRARFIEREARALAEAEQYEELAFAARSDGLDFAVCGAAANFDGKHIRDASNAQRQLAVLRYIPKSTSTASGFRTLLKDVFRNRYVLEETYDPFEDPPDPPKPRRRYHRAKHRWRLEDSVWASRRTSGNSRSFLETTQALKRMFMTDWKIARDHHKLAGFLISTQLSMEERKAIGEDVVFDHPVVIAVERMLLRYLKCIYDAFDHFAMLGCKDLGLESDHNFYVTFNSYLSFIAVCRLEEANGICDLGRLENIWSLTDAADKKTKDVDRHNKLRVLNRHEWIQVLVRIAILKFCPQDNFNVSRGDAAEALERLCNDHMMANLPLTAFQDSNAFRKDYCYLEGTDIVLKQNLPMLRALYKTYSKAANQGVNDHFKLQDNRWMNVGEWVQFVRHVGLAELGLATESMMQQVFVWSRIRSCTDHSDEQEMRVRHMFFEDFMEGLVRLASVIALPTKEEIQSSGAEDAGEFMLTFHAEERDLYAEFAETRAVGWFQNPFQPIQACVEHVLSIISRIVLDNIPEARRPKDKGDITHAHVDLFREIVLQRSHRPSLPRGGVTASRILHSLASVEQRILGALASVPAFRNLSLEQLTTLRTEMTVSQLEDGEYVFEQGEEGNAFYLITKGAANVLYYDPRDPKKTEVTLATLGIADCFGERALLDNAPRAASIMAQGPLCVVYITRERFEKVLGPLSSFVLRERAENEAEVAEQDVELYRGVGAKPEIT